MVSHYPAKFDNHWHCGSRDIIFLVAEEVSRCSHFNLPLLFIAKRHDLKAHGMTY